MLKFNNLININVNVHKFYGDNDWSKGDYDRQIIEGLILHTFRYKILKTLNKYILQEIKNKYFYYLIKHHLNK